MHRGSLTIPKELWKRATIQCVRDEITLAELIERALEDYLSRLQRFPKPKVAK